MRNLYIYLSFFIIVSLNSCGLFETKIIEDRDSFIKIYHINNDDYTGFEGNYIVKTGEGFLLGGSFIPEPDNGLSTQIQVGEFGNIIKQTNFKETINKYKKIIPSDNGQDFYFLGSYNDENSSYIAKNSLDTSVTTFDVEKKLNEQATPADFCVLSDNSLLTMVVTDENVTELKYWDADLNNTIWERDLKFDDTGFDGLSVIYENETGHFIILGKDSDYKLFVVEINKDGNIIDTRFFEEFDFGPISLMDDKEYVYEPVLLDMKTHYVVVERGNFYVKTDNSPLFSIYKISKDLDSITRFDTDTEFAAVSTVQKLDNEIVMNGFLADSIFAIKKLDSEGNLVDWQNGDKYVTFDMDIATLNNRNKPVFSNSPSFATSDNSYNSSFLPGNIVKTDNGYAMIGSYGIFNGDDFETVITLFKFKDDGSY